MKLSQMKYFCSVCKFNNISKAAEELYVSQPAISFSIKELEEELGVKLLHRQNNKLTLTAEGSYFFEKVSVILDDIDRLTMEMKDKGNNKNHIKIGVPAMIGAYLFPEMFMQFKQLYPNIVIEILEQGSLETRKNVENGNIDLGLAILNDNVDGLLNAIKLTSSELVFCVNKKHPLAKLKEVTFSDLANVDLIMFKADSYQTNTIIAAFKAEDIEPRVLIHSSQLYTIKNFLTMDNVGAFLFKDVAKMDNDLAMIPLKNHMFMDIGLIWNKRSNLYSDVENFIRFANKFNIERNAKN